MSQHMCRAVLRQWKDRTVSSAVEMAMSNAKATIAVDEESNRARSKTWKKRQNKRNRNANPSGENEILPVRESALDSTDGGTLASSKLETVSSVCIDDTAAIIATGDDTTVNSKQALPRVPEDTTPSTTSNAVALPLATKFCDTGNFILNGMDTHDANSIEFKVDVTAEESHIQPLHESSAEPPLKEEPCKLSNSKSPLPSASQPPNNLSTIKATPISKKMPSPLSTNSLSTGRLPGSRFRQTFDADHIPYYLSSLPVSPATPIRGEVDHTPKSIPRMTKFGSSPRSPQVVSGSMSYDVNDLSAAPSILSTNWNASAKQTSAVSCQSPLSRAAPVVSSTQQVINECVSALQSQFDNTRLSTNAQAVFIPGQTIVVPIIQECENMNASLLSDEPITTARLITHSFAAVSHAVDSIVESSVGTKISSLLVDLKSVLTSHEPDEIQLDSIMNSSDFGVVDLQDLFPLHLACCNDFLLKKYPGIIARLCQKLSNQIGVCNYDGDLPLHCLLRSRYASLVDVSGLVEANDLSLRIRDGKNIFPLHLACANSLIEIVNYILGKDQTVLSESPSVVRYALRGHLPFELVVRLVTAGATLVDDESQSSNRNILHEAAAAGSSLAIVQYLKEQMPSLLNSLDCNDKSPLFVALSTSAPSRCCKYFLQQTSDVLFEQINPNDIFCCALSATTLKRLVCRDIEIRLARGFNDITESVWWQGLKKNTSLEADVRKSAINCILGCFPQLEPETLLSTPIIQEDSDSDQDDTEKVFHDINPVQWETEHLFDIPEDQITTYADEASYEELLLLIKNRVDDELQEAVKYRNEQLQIFLDQQFPLNVAADVMIDLADVLFGAHLHSLSRCGMSKSANNHLVCVEKLLLDSMPGYRENATGQEILSALRKCHPPPAWLRAEEGRDDIESVADIVSEYEIHRLLCAKM